MNRFSIPYSQSSYWTVQLRFSSQGGFDIKKPTVYMPLKKKAKLYHYAFNNHFARAYFKAELNVFEIKKEFPRLVAVSRLNYP